MNYNFSVYVKITRERGNKVYGHCPLHNDKQPSFMANNETGHWKCFSHCGEGFIDDLEALLSNPSSRSLSQIQTPIPKTDRWAGYQKTATYFYRDVDNKLSARVLRMEHPTQGKQFIQQHYDDKGQWKNGAYAGQLAPYKYEHWKNSTGPVFFVEGEKCVDFLSKLGLNATTTPGGANAYKKGYANFLMGRQVVILPDNDEAGRKYAQAVFDSLNTLSINSKIIELPNLGPSEDVVDWFDKEGSIDSLLKVISSP